MTKPFDLWPYNCAACGASIELERFGDDAPCPACGVVLRLEHECGTSPDDDYQCADWTEVAEKASTCS